MTTEKLTLDEWKQRYAASRAVDRLERQHALQHFRIYWREYMLEGFFGVFTNVLIGYTVGLVLFTVSMLPLVNEIGAALSLACGGAI